MEITIAAWGGHGDVRPCVALALELQKIGHIVRFATHIEHKEFVSSFGINCVPMEWNAPERSYFLDYPPFISIGFHSNQVASLQDGLLSELWRVCQHAEAIIFNPPLYPCYYIAEKLGIPCYAACVQPHHQTAAFPHPFVTDGKPLGSIYNYLSYPFFEQVFWQSVRQPINKWRQETLKVSPLSVWKSVVRDMQQKKIPFLYSYSPAFLPKPSEWTDDCIYVTGYWFLDTLDNWQPPTNLMNFLSAGSPPIYIDNIHDETGERIIVQSLDEHCDTEITDKLFYIKERIPHEWLFPRMAAVVHHGGCGTTMNCLRAGVPMIITPFIGEHERFFWALQIAQSGLGISLIPQKGKLSYKRLSAAIKSVINDKNMQTRSIEMSKRIQAEEGIKLAVEAFHRYLPSSYKSQFVSSKQ